ncbi:MAG: hypothetical protein JXA41_03635 [Deltaproteobacteria bacterium]|nr:hypothetical protein [Deltaproteobacteria bacterium]
MGVLSRFHHNNFVARPDNGSDGGKSCFRGPEATVLCVSGSTSASYGSFTFSARRRRKSGTLYMGVY